MRTYLNLICFVGLLSLSNRSAAEDSFERLIRPALQQHCVGCHGDDEPEARLNLEHVDRFQVSDRHLWTMIHEQLSAGKMPPADEEQIAAAEKKRILAWIETQQRTLEAGSTRRLNRRELGSALRDLTGVDVDFAYSIPADSKVDGFDTGAEALQDAADSVSQLMEVTRRAVDSIRFMEPPASETLVVDLASVEKEPHRKFDPWKESGIKLEKLPRIAMPGMGALIEPKWPKDRNATLFRILSPAQNGVVRVKFTVASYSAFAEVPNPIAWIKIGGRVLDRREVSGPMDLEYFVQLEDSIVGDNGLAIGLTPRVELAYKVRGFENEDRSKPENLPNGAGLFRPVWDKRKLREPEQQPRPFVALKRVELDPLYVAAWPPQHWNVDLGKITDSRDSADKLLSLWMDRAYRRPATPQERKPFLSFFSRLRSEGRSFDNALRATFQSVLMSGPFRYLDSTNHQERGVADHAVASRLSFMLVGSPPDEELRRIAASVKIRKPEVLRSQVARLLDDPESYALFVKPFVTQWLEMEQPITLVNDRLGMASYHFRRYLQDSMRDETYAYFHQMLVDNRPASELISSDWTMMNDALANYYRYAGVEGGHLRKVKLKSGDPRGGGIMSHAGIQSMLCWMGDNWVIYRGAWTARHILADPPQLPPLEVPELDPSSGELKKMTPRELMAYHRADEKCSVCHTRLDPIGFAFQNFDLSGRWRDVEYESYTVDALDGKVAWRGKGKSRAVDTVGQLPRGEEFRSFDEFKQLLVDEYQDDMVRGLMQHFMLYATGRKPDIDDLAEIDAIMKNQKSKGYPLREMLLSVFETNAFLEH